MEEILNFQNDLHTRIIKARGNFKKSPKERISISYIESRLEALEHLWLKFLTGHEELMRKYKTEQLAPTAYVKNDLYEMAEDAYIDYKCELKSKLNELNKHGTNSRQDVSQTEEKPMLSVKLPKINIPNFSGKYVEWCTFKSLFESLIHENKLLNHVQKLHYLKGYLVGEAEQLLRHIPISGENYERCWNLLEERYNNKKYICHQILKRFLSQKNIVNESAGSLRDLIDTSNECLSALSNLGINIKSWDVIVVHLLTLKLDMETRRQWEFHSSASNELLTYDDFKEFLTTRYRAVEFLESKSNPSNRTQSARLGKPVNDIKSLHVHNTQCYFCNEGHKLCTCKQFAAESVDFKRNFVQKNKLCFNCLGNSHLAKGCKSQTRCRICQRKHHYLLHGKQDNSGNVVANAAVNDQFVVGEDVAIVSEASCYNVFTPSVSCFPFEKGDSQVLLATALVQARSRNGENYAVRALLDQGSQASFITEAMVQYLGLKRMPIKSQISGLGKNKNVISKTMVNMEIKSMMDVNISITVRAYVIKSITTLLPTKRVEVLDWKELHEIRLADPQYHTPNRIDMLLGAEIYSQILRDGVKRGPKGTPIAQYTSLGWILSGLVGTSHTPSSEISVMHCMMDDNDNLKKFWELESDVDLSKEKLLTKDELYCENMFSNTTYRDSEGRYVVRLPFKSGTPQVDDSLATAERRSKSLENGFRKNNKIRKKYTEVIHEYLMLNHRERAMVKDRKNGKAIYLPHHCVIRDVKIKEDGLPSSRWLYGRIISIDPGLDKVFKVVTLGTKNGIIKRPTNKLCILP